jgi:uncharacterized membrane protein YccC
MHPTTRQAIQASIAGVLAMIAGTLISTTRWYWAVIAAFVVFTRTTTRGETLVRGIERVVGTAIGVLGGVWLGTVFAGHSNAELALVFASVFIAYYFVQTTQLGMAVGLTLMLAALYGVLGRFTPGLLYLRLSETAAGCIIGAGVAMFVLPASTHRHVREHVDAVLTDLAELLERRFAPGSRPMRDQARLVDRRIRDLRTASRPLLAVAEQTRQLVHLVAAAWYFARHLALRAATPLPEAARARLEVLARQVAANARAAAAAQPATDHADAIDRARAEITDEQLLGAGPASPRAALDWLGRIDRVLVELAGLTHDRALDGGAAPASGITTRAVA